MNGVAGGALKGRVRVLRHDGGVQLLPELRDHLLLVLDQPRGGRRVPLHQLDRGARADGLTGVEDVGEVVVLVECARLGGRVPVGTRVIGRHRDPPAAPGHGRGRHRGVLPPRHRRGAHLRPQTRELTLQLRLSLGPPDFQTSHVLPRVSQFLSRLLRASLRERRLASRGGHLRGPDVTGALVELLSQPPSLVLVLGSHVVNRSIRLEFRLGVFAVLGLGDRGARLRRRDRGSGVRCRAFPRELRGGDLIDAELSLGGVQLRL